MIFLRKTIFITLLSCYFNSFSQIKVKAQINFEQSYCGGIRPPAEILENITKPKPYANKTIVIISNKGNVDSLKTNETGFFSVKLKKGSYKVFESWRFYKKGSEGLPESNFEKDCLKIEWQKEILEIIITKKGIKITNKNKIINHCTWDLPCMHESNKPPVSE